MNRKWKLGVAAVLTALFGLGGFNVALGGLISGASGIYVAFALLPFLACAIVTWEQYDKFKKEHA